LQDFDGKELLAVLCELVRLDAGWVPGTAFSSLYIRPVMIGTEATIGLGASNRAKLFVVTGPVGAYFPSGFQPISLLADPAFVRAFPGGVGSYKMGWSVHFLNYIF
jgi:branched-chain amino acid aminotransferase